MLIKLDTDIEDVDLIYSITHSLSHEDLIEFISNLEAAVEDWEVCYTLGIHFMRLLKSMDDEEPRFGLQAAIKEVMK